MSSATPSSWGSVDGIQLRKSVSVGAAAGNRASDHMFVEGAVGFSDPGQRAVCVGARMKVRLSF
jgi:hypothetical protein